METELERILSASGMLSHISAALQPRDKVRGIPMSGKPLLRLESSRLMKLATYYTPMGAGSSKKWAEVGW